MVFWFHCFIVLRFCGFYGFAVLWFSGFIVLWFYGFIVLWFYGFLVSKYQIYISCFQEDIDLISTIFKILLNESSGCLGARLFHNCQHSRICEILIFAKIIFSKILPIFSYNSKVFLIFKSINKGSQRSKNHKSWNFEVLVSPIIKPKLY